MIKREKWFINRIGKRVFRNKTTCNCKICQHVYENGLIIIDKDHADYLDEIENSYNRDGFALKYFDTKKEVEDYESTRT